jgi:hypothetical protein
MSTASKATSGTQLRCEECGTPAALDQRYCLNCGAHINEAPDPVAVYFSEASAARTRVAAAMARGAIAKRSRRLPRVSAASALVLVVIALLIGIAIGHSSSSGSSKSGTTGKVTTTATRKSGSSSNGGSTASGVTRKTGKSYRQQENNLPTTVSP